MFFLSQQIRTPQRRTLLCQNILLIALVFLFNGCAQFKQQESSADDLKFHRLYGFYTPKSEDDVKILASLGVKGLCTSTKAENIALLHQYGIEAYAAAGPVGIHGNVFTPEEQAMLDHLYGKDLPKDMPAAERQNIINKRFADADYSYGGEPLNGKKEIFWEGSLPCIIGEESRKKACAKLDKICEQPGIDGIAFDYVGYSNYYGCHHPDCLNLCREYLKKHNLADTPENRHKFYLFELAEYYRVCAEHIKKINPKFRVMTHLYPVFTPKPLYGKHLNVDIVGETCAWYRIWDMKKIEDYAKTIRREQQQYYKTTECVPFIGFSAVGLVDKKDAARVEQELQAILRSGSDSLMVHEFSSVLAVPEVLEVFRKYCSPQ